MICTSRRGEEIREAGDDYALNGRNVSAFHSVGSSWRTVIVIVTRFRRAFVAVGMGVVVMGEGAGQAG